MGAERIADPSDPAAQRIGAWMRLVRFSHSVFALPFALGGAWLAAGGIPRAATLAWIVVCAVAARTAAMSFNRLVDADIDARNPRTSTREIPSGKLARTQVAWLALAASAVFVACAFALNRLCGWLSPAVLAVLLGYSFTKRFTALAHAVLGLSLALAPLGAWLAVRGSLAGELAPPLLLALAVLCWVAGFDLIYACQDADFDRAEGLYSAPARIGIAASLVWSRAAHVVTVAALVLVGVTAERGWIYFAALGLCALLLAWEHSLVSSDDLSRVDVAFFTANGWVGALFFAGLALDLWAFPPQA